MKNQNGKVFLLVFLIGLLTLMIGAAIFVGIKSNGFKDFDFLTTAIEQKINNGKSGTKKLTLLVDGVEIDSIDILSSESTRIDVQNGGNFSVKIRPAENADFDFLLDGTLHAFAAADGDYNAAFELEINTDEGYFVLHRKTNIEEILTAAYPDHDVSDIECNYCGTLFEIVITAENGNKTTVMISGIVGDVMTIELEASEIVF